MMYSRRAEPEDSSADEGSIIITPTRGVNRPGKACPPAYLPSNAQIASGKPDKRFESIPTNVFKQVFAAD
jgi:hypothetical protein